jgi:nucleoside 2-deoxyribosyltransferase
MQINAAPANTEPASGKKVWKVYFAGPLFSLNERASNRRLAKAIMAADSSFKVMLPQDIKYHNAFNDKRFFAEVYRACIRGVEAADIVIALLDGPSSDDGTCYEVGYAVAKGIPVVGVRTDYRASQEMGCNLMLSRGCTAFVHRPAFDEDFDGLAKDIVRKLKRILSAKTSA